MENVSTTESNTAVDAKRVGHDNDNLGRDQYRYFRFMNRQAEAVTEHHDGGRQRTNDRQMLSRKPSEDWYLKQFRAKTGQMLQAEAADKPLVKPLKEFD
ncbi:MAG: hypothetical protein L6R41_001263 [Letrouitia leprolyta]|nr:MAG: hypothetical protein L6R41_001263 [Letrouitia leprolyta]